MLQVKLLS